MNVRFYLSYGIKITLKCLLFFSVKKLRICHYVRNIVMDVITQVNHYSGFYSIGTGTPCSMLKNATSRELKVD